jgi:uncharacterized protein (TIGR00255 family)
MKSMTGFGKSVCELPGKKVTIEIRSLNSKQLDLNLRTHTLYRDKEPELRQLLSRSLERGKIDFSIFVETAGENQTSVINQTLAAGYYAEIKKLAETTGATSNDYLGLVLRMPDVLKQDRVTPDENEWKQVMISVEEAIAGFNRFRDDEGKILEAEFRQRIGLIQSKLAAIAERDPQRIASVRDRLHKAISESVPAGAVDQNRFEQELIYYLEKLDITEEKLRLQTHCDYFLSTMSEASSGRKLGFITQEIGREINTIGSKANDAAIQKMVVEMKDELEKIKEQMLNVL